MSEIAQGPDRFVLIIGAMKCGTSSLFHNLSFHPALCGSATKEPMYFSQHAYSWDTNTYLSLWPDWDGSVHHRALEASTNYTKSSNFPAAAPRIAAAARREGFDFRFIYIVRHPIERLDSFYRNALLNQEWGKSFPLPSAESDIVAHHAIETSRYAKQIDLYLEHFSRDQLLLLKFEDFISDPITVLNTVCTFLGVPPLPSWPKAYQTFNSSRSLLVHWRNRIPGGLPSGITAADLLAWQLPQVHRDKVMDLLRDDMWRLRYQHGLDTSSWDL